MKTTPPIIALITLLFFIAPSVILAQQQVPYGINYQAALSHNGAPIKNKLVSIRVLIMDNSEAKIFWREDHSLKTDIRGVVNFTIGNGMRSGGVIANFKNINWIEASKIEIELDETGGIGTFTSLGTFPLWSVPYAFVADSALKAPVPPVVPYALVADTVLSVPVVDTVIHAKTADSLLSFSTPWKVKDSNIHYSEGMIAVNVDTPKARFHLMDSIQLINKDSQFFGLSNPSFLIESVANTNSIWNDALAVEIDSRNLYGSSAITATSKLGGFGLIAQAFSGTYATGVSGKAAGGTNSNVGGNFEAWADSSTSANRGVQIATYGDSSSNAVNYGVLSHVYGTGLVNVALSGKIQTVNNALVNTALEAFSTSSGSYNNYGVYASAKNAAAANFAGFFDGDVHVNGYFTKSAGSFKIDHPLDPENKFLVHSFIESPDMMNIYNGNIITAKDSTAIVRLPSYFTALNKDYRYQLTVIGEFAQAIVLEEIQENAFKIKTSKPNIKVSWQVTGVRNDAYAQQNRVVVEPKKRPNEQGLYLNPELYGQASNKRLFKYTIEK